MTLLVSKGPLFGVSSPVCGLWPEIFSRFGLESEVPRLQMERHGRRALMRAVGFCWVWLGLGLGWVDWFIFLF